MQPLNCFCKHSRERAGQRFRLDESEDESSTYNKQVQRPSLLEFQRVLDVNASNNPLLENEVVRKRRSEILSSDDSDDFDPPDDYLDVNQKKSSQVSADKIRKKRKTESPDNSPNKLN